MASIIEEFNETLLKSPGLICTMATVDQLTDSQLQFQREVLEGYNNNFINEGAEIVDEATIRHALKLVDEELTIRGDKINSVKWEYINCPYLTTSEISNMLNENAVRRDIRERIIHNDINPSNYQDKIKELELKLNSTDDPDEIAYIKNLMISLGWNPEVECTQENMIKCKERIEKIYTQEMRDFCKFIDATNDDFSSIPVNEQELDNDIKALYITVYKNGNAVLCEHPTLDEDGDIYSVYMQASTLNNVMALKELFEERADDAIFIAPSNYECYVILKNISEAFGIDSNPIVSKVYDCYSGKEFNAQDIANNIECRKRNINDDNYKMSLSCTVWE
jgi:hypothetical protein